MKVFGDVVTKVDPPVVVGPDIVLIIYASFIATMFELDALLIIIEELILLSLFWDLFGVGRLKME